MNGSGRTYIVKISNAAEPEGVVDFQIKALTHTAEQDSSLPVPRVIPTQDDKPFGWIHSESGDHHIIRMLTYVEGDVMDTCPMHLPASCVTRFSIMPKVLFCRS